MPLPNARRRAVPARPCQINKTILSLPGLGTAARPLLHRAREIPCLYDPEKLALRPNVPEHVRANTRKILAGYYAHCTALDACLGDLRRTLAETGLTENTLLIFTSDHGDMLGSQAFYKKQKPYDEAIRIPFLMRWPEDWATNRVGWTPPSIRRI